MATHLAGGLVLALALVTVCLCPGCPGGGGSGRPPIVVNSLDDIANPPEGTVTLRSALAGAASGQRIVFDASLDGGTIALSVVGEDHTILKGEVMGMRIEPSGPVSYLEGYFERDYGKSALYTVKNVVIDASALPSGITVAWTGGPGSHARVLAVYGDLVMLNVTITGGSSQAEDISTGDPDDQPWTLARGGGVAVWGSARLEDCTLHDNHCVGDFQSSRDRGAFGGGLYANRVDLRRCVIGGNTVLGGGAAGGGVYSVGGADAGARVTGLASRVSQCSITGNLIQALFTYGGGLYSDGGGIGNSSVIEIENTTIARNKVAPPPGLPPDPLGPLGIGYWRGGGFYMSNGGVRILSCTIVENEVHGMPRTDDLGKRNLAGGIAATIGNAHAVEDMVIGHSIIAGNTVHEVGAGGATYEQDIFTGSLVHFRSLGYNRIGTLDFSQILVPVGQWGWTSLSRRHFPKEGDEDGALLADVVDLVGGVTVSGLVLSEGVDAGSPTPRHYRPQGGALDQVPTSTYVIDETYAQYDMAVGVADDFLSIVLARIEDVYGIAGFAADFEDEFENYLQTVDVDDDEPGEQRHRDPSGNPILTLAETQWFGPAVTWPKEVSNFAYIQFWHRLDEALAARGIPGMGSEGLGDEAWSALFASGTLAENTGILMSVEPESLSAIASQVDQRGTARPANALCDIGAIETP